MIVFGKDCPDEDRLPSLNHKVEIMRWAYVQARAMMEGGFCSAAIAIEEFSRVLRSIDLREE